MTVSVLNISKRNELYGSGIISIGISSLLILTMLVNSWPVLAIIYCTIVILFFLFIGGSQTVLAYRCNRFLFKIDEKGVYYLNCNGKLLYHILWEEVERIVYTGSRVGHVIGFFKYYGDYKGKNYTIPWFINSVTPTQLFVQEDLKILRSIKKYWKHYDPKLDSRILSLGSYQ